MDPANSSIIVFGSRGYLGQKFLELYPHAVASTADIAEPAEVRAELEKHTSAIVINAAGKTGRPNIDWCEEHKEETLRANVTGPLVLLDACRKRNMYLVHLSSGCIYSGDNNGKGFTENDQPNFTGSYYSRTKAQVDALLAEFSEHVLILRLRMPFDGSGNERTLIQKLKRYPRVHNLPNSLTYIPDFIQAADSLIKKSATGIYHIVNPGTASPYEIMKLYQEIVDPNHVVELLSDEEVQTIQKAGRSNCLLNTEKLAEEGVILLSVQEAIKQALQQMA